MNTYHPQSLLTSLLSVPEADMHQWIERIYERLRNDPLLAPTLGIGLRPDADPPEHNTWQLFESWLTNIQELYPAMPRSVRTILDNIAQQIAMDLWKRDQQQPSPPTWQRDVPNGLELYKTSPLFTQDTLPTAFRKSHATKTGVWGLIRMRRGMLSFMLDEPQPRTRLLQAHEQLVVAPNAPHHVFFIGEGSFVVDFYRQPTTTN